MVNVIIPNQTRREDVEYIAKKYGIDCSDPAMREAAEVAAARTKETTEMARKEKRVYSCK